MIEVRLRHIYETRAVRLMDWPSNDLDSVIPCLLAWGVYHPEVDDPPVANGSEDMTLWGAIRHDGTHAYFEVVIDEA